MSFLSKLLSVKAALMLAMLVGAAAMAQTAPSQDPLLSRDGGGVPPNIMLTMDDSGSMTWSHMPEVTVYAGAYTIANPIGSNGARMDPGESSSKIVSFIGTVAAVPGSSNYRQRLLRSPDTNTIYYNPEIRYDPWAVATGGRMTAYSAAAAPLDPMNPSTGGTVNLTNSRSITNNGLTWCYRTSSSSSCGTTSSAVSYDPGLYYRLKKDGSGAYLDPSNAANYTEFSINTGTSFTKYSGRTDCAGASCTQAEERQNFSNWFTYYHTRNLLARGSILEAFFDATNTFRLGWGRINQGSSRSIDGVNTTVIESGVRAFDSTAKANLFNWVQALPASGSTPLPRAMRAVGEYYKRSDNKGPWSDNPGQTNSTVDKSCRRAYQIVVTDGYWNQTTTSVGNSDNTDGAVITGPGRTYQYVSPRPYRDGYSDRLADYAMEYWKNDLRTDLTNNVVPSADNPAFWQHMVNFMVGLGVRGTLDPAVDLPALTAGTKAWGTDEIDDLWHSALNSRGVFFSAKDPKELADSIKNSVGQALERELREAGVATASTILQDGNRKYIPMYRTSDWNGDIQAYLLDSAGQAGALSWTATSKLPTWSSRNIYTWRTDTVPSTAVPFTWTDMGADNQAALGSVGSTYTSSLVDFLRGDRSKEGDSQPFRVRKGILGDFINSNPVLVKDAVNMGYISLPTTQGGGAAYSSFLTQKAARPAVLFVGANDGMLHAFKDTLGAVPADDGKEIFAYVPRAVYPNLSKLSDKTYGTALLYHQFFVDGPLMETDAYVKAPGASTPSWRNYLLGTLGAGGRAVFALDVTDNVNLGASSVRWELSSASNGDMGYISAPVQVGVLPNGEWVAIFGNGSYSTSGNAVLFVVNLETGVAQTLTVDSSGANGLGGVGVVRNSSGQITTLYAGDLKGSLWKFDYLDSASSRFQVSGGAAFFAAASSGGTPQPITQAPIAYDFSRGGKLVVFGTGVLNTTADANSTAVQSIYAVWDKAADTLPRPMGRSVLEPRTITAVTGVGGAVFYSLAGTAVNWATQRGWVLDLDVITGLRVVYPLQSVSSSVVLVSAVAPARNVQVCDTAAGSGMNLMFGVEDGVNPSYPMFDTNGDGIFGSDDTRVAGYATGADGIDAVVRGEKTCVSGICTTKLSIQNTAGQFGASIQETQSSVGVRVMKDRVWRHIINPPIR